MSTIVIKDNDGAILADLRTGEQMWFSRGPQTITEVDGWIVKGGKLVRHTFVHIGSIMTDWQALHSHLLYYQGPYPKASPYWPS